MVDLKTQFESAAQEAQRLPKKPDNDTLLRLYALYKQATIGNATGKRPGFTDPVGRAKFDAWEKIKGMTAEQAMQKYIELVNQLKSS
ncbi:MAG: putative acyl-CoA-binding protein [Chloroflexi bacterium]|jgi:acyl-CoA-binding protein|nr:putative acyl-CoA-binding protein [Chloroflexota bacterium]